MIMFDFTTELCDPPEGAHKALHSVSQSVCLSGAYDYTHAVS